MKKYMITLLCLMLIMHNLYANIFDFLKNGEYATYHDTRGDMDFFRAYWGNRVDDGTFVFFIKNINNKNNKMINYIVFLIEDENGKPTIQKIEGVSKNQPYQYQQSYIDILNFISCYNAYKDSINWEKTIEDPWDNYTLLYNYKFYLPLFKFDTITMKGQNSPCYKLISAGKIDAKNHKDFFELQPINTLKTVVRKNLSIPTKTKKQKPLHEYAVTLDDNWHFNNELGSPGYWLSLFSHRDSQIMLEKGKLEKFKEAGITNLTDFIMKTLYFYDERIIIDSLSVVRKNEGINISYVLLDEHNAKNFIIRKFWLENEYVYTLNFSTFKDIYDKNKKYYQNILKSFKKNIR